MTALDTEQTTQQPAAPPPRPMLTVRMARWSATHPWRAILAWVAFVAICLVGGSAVGTKHQTTEGGNSEAARAERIIDGGHFPDPDTEAVLVTARHGTLDTAAARAALAEATQRLRALPQVTKVEAPVMAPNGKAMLVEADLAKTDGKTSDEVTPLLAATATVQQHHPQLRVEEVGNDSINKALDATLGKDFHRAEILSIPASLLILVLAFGALIAAGIPVLLGLTAVMAALGLAGIASHLVPQTNSLSSVVLLIGMAVGVDYSLFYVRREREERARGLGHVDAVEVAAATSGHAVVVSGFAVIVAMAGMYVSGDSTFASMATGSILVVAVAVLGSLTVLPAVLAKLGRWVDRPRVPFLWRLTARRSRRSVWGRVLRPVLRRPAVALVASVGVLAALAIPALGMKLKLVQPQDLPRSIPIMQSYDRLTAAFPSHGSEHVIAVEAPASERAQVRTALRELGDRTQANPLFAHDRAPELKTSADGRVSTLTVGVPGGATGPAATETLQLLRSELVPQTVGRVPHAQYGVTGDPAGNHDFVQQMNHRLPLSIGFVLVLTFLIMLWTFDSVVVAATAIGLNLLSAGAAFGVLVLVFQNTWAQGLLGFHSTGAIVAWLPLLLFVILFGLSMDYHVFVVSRIREASLRGMPTRAAVQEGITGSAGVVTSAAAVMVAVFSVFATLTTIDMKQLGVGLAAAIPIDATIIRAIVLPAVMAMLGRWNWWSPAPLRRRRSLPVA